MKDGQGITVARFAGWDVYIHEDFVEVVRDGWKSIIHRARHLPMSAAIPLQNCSRCGNMFPPEEMTETRHPEYVMRTCSGCLGLMAGG